MSESEPERTVEQRKSDAVFWAKVFWTIFAVAVCTVGFEILRHLYEWLRYGQTDRISLFNLIQKPAFQWIGVQKILDFIWNLPIWMIAVAMTFITAWLADQYDEEAKALGSKK